MKHLITLITLFIYSTINLFAQVDDIGMAFTCTGFVQNIDYDGKQMLANLILDDPDYKGQHNISSQVLQLSASLIVNEKDQPVAIESIRSSDEIKVTGNYYRKRGEYVTAKIIIQDKVVRSVDDGRIDLIKGGFAYIDGNKVKLAEGKTIKGSSKAGYKGKTFKAVTELMHGDYADVSGKYNAKESFLAANDFTVSPDLDTRYDKSALEIDKEDYEKFYPIWSNPAKRSSLFGTKIEGVGKISADAQLQEYVNTVGLKLVPDHMKEKFKFIFIVVDNPAWGANVRANGLAYVYTGLLQNLDNEAQLAAVLGHEISHAIYEHSSDEEKKKEHNSNTKHDIDRAKNAVTNVFKSKDKKKEDEEKDVANKKALVENKEDIVDASKKLIDKRHSDYSIKQELQADRVGLFLMVNAGYDAREAPVVWKNIYERYNKVKDTGKTILDHAMDEVTADKTKKDVNANSRTTERTSIASESVGYFIKWKAEDYHAKSFRTHPNELKRFEELNKLIALYWNAPELIASSTNSEDMYIKMKKRIPKVSTPKKKK